MARAHRMAASAAWMGPIEAATVAVGALRLARRGRKRAAAVVVASWAGAQVAARLAGIVAPPPKKPRGAGARRRGPSRAGMRQNGLGVGAAYGFGRIAPPWRLPLLTASAAADLSWGNTPLNEALPRWLAALVGAQLAVAVAERLPGPAPDTERKVAVVWNVDSGSQHLARRAVRALRRQPVKIVGVQRTDGPGLAAAFEAALASLPPGGVLAVAGGDGTVGFAAGQVAHQDRVLAILPTGTGNDLARSLGLPLCPEEAAALVAKGAIGDMDLARTGDRSFAHASTLGMTADFSLLVRGIKGWRRPLRYPVLAWRSWRDRHPLVVEVLVDGQPVALPAPPFELAVINAPRLGGRVGVSLRDAAPDDGRLHLVSAHTNALRQTLQTQSGFLRTRATPTLPRAMIRHGQVVEIRSESPLPVSLDGEPLATTPFTVRIDPGACRVIR